MKSFLIGLIIASMTGGPATAQCYSGGYRARYCSPVYSSYSTYVAPTYAAPVYVEPVKVVKEVAYQAIIPVFQLEVRQYKTYGAVYIPPIPEPNPQQQQAPASGSAPNGQSAELRQILELMRGQDVILKGLDARIKSLEDKVGVGKEAPVPKSKPKDPFNPDKEGASTAIPDVRAVVRDSCVSCHQRGNEDNGGGFVLVEKDGTLIKLSARQSFNVVRHVERGTMPPAKAVTAGKVKAVTDAGAAAVKEEMFRQQEARAAKTE